MKTVKYILLLVMLLVSYAASATAPVFGTTAQNKHAHKFAPPKGKAVVYIYQRRGDGKSVSPTIWLNKYKVGRLVPGAFTVWKLSPGRLRIRVDANKPTGLSMVSEAGKIYRFRLSVTQTAAGPRARLTRMSESSRSDMAKTRWIKNPRTVTYVTAVAPVFGTAAQNKHAHTFAPPKGKAVIYIYQRRGDGSGVSPTIWLNKYKVGRLVPGAFTVWKLSPGRFRIRVGGTKPTGLSMVSEAGKIYRFRLSVTQTAAGPRARLTHMSESSRSDMAKTRWIKNPRTVTLVATKRTRTKRARVKPDVPVVPGDFGLMLKAGALTLSEDTQMILGSNRLFEERVSGLYAIEAYYQFDTGFTLGAEILRYTAEFTTEGLNDRHDIVVTIPLVNAKKYFRTDSSLQPFIGAGIGYASTDISGPTLNGDTDGFAYQVMTGVEYRGNNVGVFGEVKYVGADTEDDNKVSFDVSGIGFFAGIAFHF